MSIGNLTSAQALQAFLVEKDLPSANRINRLYIKNDQIYYDADIGGLTLIAAKLGFGSAAMSNVSKFIRRNKDTCLTNEHDITNYNTFITSYNDKQYICWKKAREIKDLAVQVFNPGLDSGTDFDYGSRDGMHQLVKHHLANCNLLLRGPNLEGNFAQLTETCQILNFSLEGWFNLEAWDSDNTITKDEKQTLNEILDFKNAVRNTVFPPNLKPLKGPVCVQKPLNNVSTDEKNNIKTALKDLRTTVLKKYFHDRIELDGAKLAQLRMRFNENQTTLPEAKFLSDQLDRWQKKLDQGKPIAIPKWYHCTKQLNTLGTILDGHILYASGCYPGVFVSNRPEVNGVGGYGDYCLVISDHIEKVGTKEPGHGTVYPKHSQMNQSQAYPIHFSDTPLAPQDNVLKNNQEGVAIWFGFQRGGVHGFDPYTKLGKAGVPLERMERIKNGSLKYYKDTTLGFIFNIHNEQALKTMGQQKRVQVVTYKEAEAMRSLINSTFHCTLPSDWQGKLTSFKQY